jgi:hypothetical protein
MRAAGYHCAPVEARASIERHGLDSLRHRGGLPGTYLWATLEAAESYALWFDDIWEVDATGLNLHAGGASELWHPQPIDPTRIIRRIRQAGREAIPAAA